MEEVTEGIDLMCSILRDKNIRHFKRLSVKWFETEPSEAALYIFINKFLERYSRLPAVESCYQRGLSTSEPVEATDYYLDLVNNRFTYNVARKFKDGLDDVKRQLTNQLLNVDLDDTNNVQLFIKDFCNNTLRLFDSGRSDSKIRELTTDILPNFRENQFKNRFITHDLGILTPYDNINNAMGGFMPEEWCIITGNMKMGKSWTWVNFILHAWLHGNNPTLITSMEMDSMDEYSTSGLATRFIAMVGGIAPALIRTGRLPDISLDRIDENFKKYGDMTAFENKGLPPLYFLEDLKHKSLDIFAEEALSLGVTVTGIDAIYKAEPSTTDRYFRGDLEKEKQVCNDRLAMCKSLKTINIDTHQFKKDALRVDDVMADNVGGHVGWTQDPNYVYGIIPEGENNDLRKWVNIAGREGDKFEPFITNFKFSPKVDFSVVEGVDDNDYDDIV